MSEVRALRVVIADDEFLSRQRLHDLLDRQKNVDVVAEAASVPAAIEAVRSTAPDLLFLDVQMPGGSGLDVPREVGAERMPVTIFVTAFDRYAIDAFDAAAIDYLLKPFDDERFEQAFSRARKIIELQSSGKEELATEPRYLETIAVESRGQTRVVDVDRIDYISASGPYAELHVGERVYAIRERMQTLDEQLPPSKFFRIHRSAIVRLDRIDALLHHGGGDYAVKLKSGIELSLSRTRREELEAALRRRA